MDGGKGKSAAAATIPGMLTRFAFKRRDGFIGTLLISIGVLAAGCQNSASDDVAAGRPHDEQASDTTSTLRIVSLSPAVSRTLVALGAEGQVVGRTPFCAALDASIPVAGDIEGADYERLIRLAPTHLLVQPPIQGIDPELERLAARKGWALGAWHLDGIAEVRGLIDDLPDLLDAGDGALRRRADRLLAALDACVTPDGATPPWSGRTLMLSHVDPPMAFGRGTYLDELLGSLGGVNAVEARGWASLTLEDVVRLDPSAIIVVRPGAATGLMPALVAPLEGMNVEAVRTGRVAWLGHEDAFLPSAGIIDVASDLRRVLDEIGTHR
jgi:ABC-type hemin transport system substrate-binding protein